MPRAPERGNAVLDDRVMYVLADETANIKLWGSVLGIMWEFGGRDAPTNDGGMRSRG